MTTGSPSPRKERGLGGEDAPTVLYFAAENLNLVRHLYPQGRIEPVISPPEAALYRVEDRDEARSRMLRGWSEASGPVLPSDLGPRLGLRPVDVERGLQQLEALGHVLRGRFTPGVASAGTDGPERTSESEDEYCDRRLLARIHRYTLDRLRREIDPVSAQDFMRFLLQWQHLAPGSKLTGKQGVRQVIARVEGFEAPAGSWESELLAARMTDYRSSWLDELCLAGDVAWARLTPRKANLTGTANAGRSTPISVTLRGDLPGLLAAVRGAEGHPTGPKTGAAAEILELLKTRGALFFDEIVNGTRRLRSDVERGLRELVAWGLVTADGFQGLRQLTGKSGSGRPSRPSRSRAGSSYSAGGFFSGSGPSGRWALIHEPDLGAMDNDEFAESVARLLLQRYGVLFRDLYMRESFTVPWRDVLRALRRLEARGIVRGGRFVSGPNGEQYALPEAVDALRRVRRTERTGERIWVSAIDPLNLAGVILPGDKQPAQAGKGTLYVDGLPQTPDASDVYSRPKAPVPSRLTPKLSVHARN